jgi:hypothetical protein
MKLNKSQKRLFIILGLVLSYAVIDVIINMNQYKSLYFGSGRESGQSANSLVKPKQKQDIGTDIQSIEFDWKRDPFKSDRVLVKNSRKKLSKAQRLFLNAITYSGSNSLVIINDQILRTGDKIGGYTVQKIYNDKVKLTKFGHTLFLRPN